MARPVTCPKNWGGSVPHSFELCFKCGLKLYYGAINSSPFVTGIVHLLEMRMRPYRLRLRFSLVSKCLWCSLVSIEVSVVYIF